MTPNTIGMFFHCGQCIEERPGEISPRDWMRLEVGWTKAGVQVWCVRHDRNVVSLDFLGQKVDFAREEPETPKDAAVRARLAK